MTQTQKLKWNQNTIRSRRWKRSCIRNVKIVKTMRNFKFGDSEIAENSPTFVIAEIGINHNGDLNSAKQLIKVAKDAG